MAEIIIVLIFIIIIFSSGTIDSVRINELDKS